MADHRGAPRRGDPAEYQERSSRPDGSAARIAVRDDPGDLAAYHVGQGNRTHAELWEPILRDAQDAGEIRADDRIEYRVVGQPDSRRLPGADARRWARSHRLLTRNQIRRQGGQLLAGLFEFAFGFRLFDDSGTGPQPRLTVALVGGPQYQS